MACAHELDISLKEKTVLITGVTSGIGFHSAESLARFGANVIGVGRDESRNRKAKEKILSNIPEANIEYLLADLSSQEQIREIATDIIDLLEEQGKNALDVLINNAGIYLEKKRCTRDGIEKTFAVNHLAPFLLSCMLSPLLHNSKQARLITVSSYAHRTTPINLTEISDPRPYIGLLAYKRSKLCNVLFTYELNRRAKGNILAFAIDPGLVNTSIASKGSKGISDLFWQFRRKQGTSPDVPVKTLLYLSGSEGVDVSQGCYFKDCSPISPSKKAKNGQLARELWELSCNLTNVDWF